MSNKPQAITETIVLKDGREVTIETGKLAKQADGAVVVKMGGTMLLATVVAAKDANPGVDFLPLTVDYREKFSAAGRVPGNFFRRESKPSDDEVLTMRLVDRVMRPLFPEDFHAEVQVMISLISYDGKVMPDSLAGLAASAAVAITDIPFNGPFSEVRVIKKDGVLSINPSWETLQSGVELDIMVGASKDSIVMVEGEMDEITEQEMIEAISFAHEEIKIQIEAQERLAARIEKAQTKREYCHETHDEELRKEIWDYAYQRYYDIAKDPSAKHERSDKFSAVVDEFLEKYTEEELEEKEVLAKTYFHDVQKEAVRQLILNENIRLDGRNNQQIRPIWCEVDYLPAAHGSSIFTRGETQSLTTVTLGSLLDANRIDSVISQHDERFFLHYNFPPFSTGEARPLRGTSRRDILGDEDHLGDMDFKVTGTAEGITACQMDIKIQGLTMDIMEKALMQARDGRMHILGEMLKTIDKPNADVKPHAPKLVMMEIPKDFIGAVIGPGGKIIQQMQKDTDTVITIEERGEIGHIEISGTDREKINAAVAQINEITFVPVIGEVYKGKVVKVMEFGAFIQLAKGTEGLLHISEIAWERTEKVPYKEGDEVEVKFMGYDDRKKMRLSRKVLLPKPPKPEKKEDKTNNK